MSLIKLQGNASGTGAFTIAAPNSNSDRTLTLPDATGTVNVSGLANEVPAGSAGAPAIYPTGDSNTGIFFPTADTIAFSEGGSEAARFDAFGNFLVGATSTTETGRVLVSGAKTLSSGIPTNQLVVADSTALASGVGGAINFIGTYTSGGLQTSFASIEASKDNGTSDAFGAAMVFKTRVNGGAQTERARIGSDGVMTLGQTSNINVFSGTADGCSIEGEGAISLSRNQNASLYIRRRSNNGAVAAFLRDTTQVGRIEVTTTATSYVTSSDYRLKEDWQPMTGASERVLALKPVNFAWKVDGSRVDGFLAHEAQEVVPEAVTGAKDEVDADGNPQYQGIDQSKLVPLLTAALQEALAEIASLKTRLTALEAN